MHTFVAILMCSVLWLGPVLVEAGTAGTGEQRPEQRQLISKENIESVRTTIEGNLASH